MRETSLFIYHTLVYLDGLCVGWERYPDCRVFFIKAPPVTLKIEISGMDLLGL
jgi:hypothetical protein